MPDEIALHATIIDMLNSLSEAELQNAFRSWIERVETWIDAGGVI
jgi:hypothetical protein